MLFKLSLFVYLMSLQSTVSDKLVSLETASIRNIEYVIANDWKEIPVNATGEDVNSDLFGGVFKRSDLSQDFIEKRVSIAKNQMELKLDLKNNTDDNYLLESISLEVKELYDISRMDFKEGKWNIGLSQEYGTPRNFIIDSAPESIIINEQKVVRPSGEEDPRFKLVVSAKDSPSQKNVILRFSIKFKVSTTGLNLKTFEINSDKDYFIAVL